MIKVRGSRILSVFACVLPAADPTADVEGLDARSKLIILSRLAFGVVLEADRIPRASLSITSRADLDMAHAMGYELKYVAFADAVGERVTSFVAPALVKRANPIASLEGPTNLVQIRSAHLGDASLVGPGAGALPTANSVVADLLAWIDRASRERKPEEARECAGRWREREMGGNQSRSPL